jgi:hypothetical protein
VVRGDGGVLHVAGLTICAIGLGQHRMPLEPVALAPQGIQHLPGVAIVRRASAPVQGHRLQRAALQRCHKDGSHARIARAGGQQHQVVDAGRHLRRPGATALRAVQGQHVAGLEAGQDAIGEGAAGHAADVELQPGRPRRAGRIRNREVAAGAAVQDQ